VYWLLEDHSFRMPLPLTGVAVGLRDLADEAGGLIP
jgi:hypothetical protein